jgi:uncharacterized membrane protein
MTGMKSMDTDSHAGRGRSLDPVLPSREDPIAQVASGTIGGPAGRHVLAESGWWTPVRVLLAMVVLVFGLGVGEKAYCRDQGWNRTNSAQYIHACYSDVPHMYRERGFAEGNLPYIDEGNYPRLEYPVIIGGVMAVTAIVARTAHGVTAQAVRFYDATALLLALCAMITVVALMKLAGRRPWDAALFALAPGLLLNGTINWDLVAVMFTALAMLAWARRHPGLAGILIGLGTATKLYPVLLLVPLLLLCVRGGRLAAFAQALLAAVASWLVVNIPIMVVAPEGWKAFYVFSRDRKADFGSIWYVFVQLGHPVPHLNLLVAVLLVLSFAGIVWLAFAAPRRPRLAQLMFLAVAAFALTNKVYSPQYVLWLIPLAALARPRWREFLVWQACESLYFFAVWYYIAAGFDPNRGLGVNAYAMAVLLHVLGTLYFTAFVIRDTMAPERDAVRADGTDDPAGGVVDRAPDAVAFALPGQRAGVPGETAGAAVP